MKHLQLIGLSACVAFLAGCESTDMAGNSGGRGNQEAKRLAALKEQQQLEKHDEEHDNLWAAQGEFLNRDGNPLRDHR